MNIDEISFSQKKKIFPVLDFRVFWRGVGRVCRVAPWAQQNIKMEAILLKNQFFFKCLWHLPENNFRWGHFWKYKPPGGCRGQIRGFRKPRFLQKVGFEQGLVDFF